MPNIYVTQAEYDAIQFFEDVAQAAHEASDNQAFDEQYQKAQNGIKNLSKKYHNAKHKQRKKSDVVASSLAEINNENN
tara:strand:- start:142 stop:375 length:234 start_codon:yes stop_codon:yes gene_type:complete